MKVEMRKKYQTAEGVPVALVTVNGRGDHPVLGYRGHDDRVSSWGVRGNFYGTQTAYKLDLVEVPEFKDRMFFNEAGLPRISVKKPLAVSMDHEEASPEEAREYAATLIKAADYAQQWADSEK